MDNFCLMMTVNDFLLKKDFDYEVIDTNKVEQIIYFAKNRVYSIPAYQREIRWTADNVNILINDLLDGKKFLGTILLNRVDNENFEIIDGQQRISVFILILKALEKIENSVFEFCGFINETYTELFEVLKLNFDLQEIINSDNKDRYLNSDLLEQRGRFEKLWQTINDKLKILSAPKLRNFKENLLNSDVNIILANNTNSRIFVDYYLDLNDKSVKLDNIDILKANLFKINYGLMASKWTEVQRTIKELRLSGLNNYKLETFYYHFFACTVNKYLGYRLTTLKTDLKFEKDFLFDEVVYEAKTNILSAVKDQEYFRKSVDQLKDIAVFFKNIYINGDLSELHQKLRSIGVDNDTIFCVISIIKTILYVDDEVPKIFLMKYYLDVLNVESINKDDIGSIFNIYVYSILFTLTASKKESVKLVRIVLSEDWKNKLEVATLTLLKNSYNKINYWKKITNNGKITDVSGKDLPKHIFAIKEFSKINGNNIKFNQKKLREYLASSTDTAEHFFINKSHKISFKYSSENKESEIVLPKSIIKYISCPINYLYVKSADNAAMGNYTIKDKIEYLSSKRDVAFASAKNYDAFCKIKELFETANNFPDLHNISNKSKAKKELLNYYKKDLIKLMEDYSNELNKEIIQIN